MTGLVDGGGAPFLLGHDDGAALAAHHHLVLGVLEFGHADGALFAARGQKRGFVDEIGEIGAGKARRAARDHVDVDVGRQRDLAQMHPQNLLAADDIGIGEHDLPVEAAGAQQRGVQHVGPVGGGEQDHSFLGVEAVHLD